MNKEPFEGKTIEEHAEVIRQKLMFECDMRMREFQLLDYSVRPEYIRITVPGGCGGTEARQFIVTVQVDPVERKQENG